MAMYWKADEAEEIARDYMKYHADLVGASVAFLFKEKASYNDGNPIVGKVSKVPERLRPLMEENSSGDLGYDFVIFIGADAWVELSRQNKEAWIDYLLEQCYGEEDKQGNMKWKIRKPSLQAFPAILSRHGVAWDAGVNHLSVLDLKKSDEVAEPETRTLQ